MQQAAAQGTLRIRLFLCRAHHTFPYHPYVMAADLLSIAPNIRINQMRACMPAAAFFAPPCSPINVLLPL